MSEKMRFLAIQGSFAAAHFYAQDQWDFEKNKAVFGKCFTTFGHGHEYRLRLNFDVTGVDDLEGFESAARMALVEVLKVFDHKHLNFDFSYFNKKIPTTENIAILIKEICQQNFSRQLVQALRDIAVFENEFIGAKP